MTELGLLLALTAVVLLALRVPPAALGLLGVPFPDSSALVVGGRGVPASITFMLLGILGEFLLRRHEPWAEPPPWERPLRWFVASAITITLIGPTLFHGMPVFSSQISLDQQTDMQSTLTFSSSNVAQVIYLGANAAFAIVLARHVSSLRSAWRVALLVGALVAPLAGIIPSLRAVLDNNPAGFYSIETARARGQFTEPSHLGVFAAVCLVYGLALCWSARREDLFFGLALAGGGIANLVAADAATSYAGVALTAAAAIIVAFVAFLRGARVKPLRLVAALGVVGVLVIVASRLQEFGAAVIAAKAGTSSQSDRFASDIHALHIFADTFMIGVGLGSNRSSSLASMLLSNVGILGVSLLLAVFFLGYARRRVTAEAWAGLAFLACAAVSYSSFTDPILWISLGVAARPLTSARRGAMTAAVASGGSGSSRGRNTACATS